MDFFRAGDEYPDASTSINMPIKIHIPVLILFFFTLHLTAQEKRPNIIFVMSDDHATAAVGAYEGGFGATPNIDRLANEGMRFDRAFCTNAICGPSRAVILTGKYSHLNGFMVNETTSFDGSQTTFPKLLQTAGYETALIGKWHLLTEPTGFDYWNILIKQGLYFDPPMNEMGTIKEHQGYVTDLISDMTIEWLKERKDSDKPFLLLTQHKAPHSNFQPPPRYQHSYDDFEFPEPATLFDNYATRSAAASDNEMRIDPHLKIQYQVYPGLQIPEDLEGEAKTRWLYQYYMRNYMGCVRAVDDAVGELLDTLDELGLAENTIVVYTSDQGFFLGEHGYYDKRLMYEPTLRQPLIFRWPGHIPAASKKEQIVLNLDYAQTFLELAGIPAPSDMQGRSLAPLLLDEPVALWRRSMYYHFYEYPGWHYAKRHYGVRTERFKLIHFYHDIDSWELYDLQEDPDEIQNLADVPEYQAIRRQLETELARLQHMYGDSPELAQEILEKHPHGSTPSWGRAENFDEWLELRLRKN